MAVGHVDPTDWLLDQWHLQALSCHTTIDDLAHQSPHRRALQHVARTRNNGYSWPRWYHPRALLHLRLHRLLQSAFSLRPGDFFFSYDSLHVRFLSLLSFYRTSSFSWLCWIAPNNIKVNQMFGVTHGLSMGLLTFDWGQIVSTSHRFPSHSGLLPTLASLSCSSTGSSSLFSTLVPISSRSSLLSIRTQYTNVWYSAYLPFVSLDSFDNRGRIYNVSQIMNANASFNRHAYKAYSPIFISATFAIGYGLSFASITATLIHTFLCYREHIWTQATRSQPDIHARLMSVDKEVPDWWYLTVFCP